MTAEHAGTVEAQEVSSPAGRSGLWVSDDDVVGFLGQVDAAYASTPAGQELLMKALSARVPGVAHHTLGWETNRWTAVVGNPMLGHQWVLANAGTFIRALAGHGWDVVLIKTAMARIDDALLEPMSQDPQLARQALTMAADLVTWWGLGPLGWAPGELSDWPPDGEPLGQGLGPAALAA